jgi:hypothetical protein
MRIGEPTGAESLYRVEGVYDDLVICFGFYIYDLRNIVYKAEPFRDIRVYLAVFSSQKIINYYKYYPFYYWRKRPIAYVLVAR